MQVRAIRTHRIRQDRDLHALLDRYLTSFDVGAILAITSKIVSICQGRMVRVEEADKQALIESESDHWLPRTASKYDVSLTIVNHVLIPMAGIDDKHLAQAKGFDCYSFKKAPTKRKPKECKK